MRDKIGRVLVCYATGTGCTKGVAEKVGETIARTHAQVDVRPFDSDPNPAEYDAIVAGSGTRAGSWHPVAKKWMARNADTLRARPVAMFTVCMCLSKGADKTEEALGYTDRLLGKANLHPVDIGVFAGWYEPPRFNFVERKIMQVMRSPEGDFRDWTAIENWAVDVAPKLVSAARASVA